MVECNKLNGTAVLTALQAQHKSIEEIALLVQHRKLHAFMSGGMPGEWLDMFWQQIAIIEAGRAVQ